MPWPRCVLILLAGVITLAGCSSDKPPSKPWAVVEIDNSNSGDVLVTECPPCKPKGAVIQGVGNAVTSGANYLGWAVKHPASLSYVLKLHGRPIYCRAPDPIPSPQPIERGYIFHLRYTVTKAGRCVVTSQGYSPSWESLPD